MNLVTGNMISFATEVFSSTIGCSDNALSAYNEESGDPRLLGLPLKNPANIDLMVNRENKASLQLPAKTLADRVAKVATPVRRIFAHGAASAAVTARLGFFDKNAYSREALSSLLSGTF